MSINDSLESEAEDKAKSFLTQYVSAITVTCCFRSPPHNPFFNIFAFTVCCEL